MLGVSYGNLVAVLTKAIQEQQKMINDKEFRIRELEMEIKKMKVLESKVNALEILMSESSVQADRINSIFKISISINLEDHKYLNMYKVEFGF